MAKLPPLMPKIQQALYFAAEKGLTLDAMRVLFPEYGRHQVNKSANALDADGRCFKSGKGKKCAKGIKWFSQKEWATAFARETAIQQANTRFLRKDQVRSEILTKQRRYEEKDADFKASNRSEPGRITSETKIRVYPTLAERAAAGCPAPAYGGFSNLKPGQYAFEPASCAAKACA